MSEAGSFAATRPIVEHPLWEHVKRKRIPLAFTLELTARCNNDCRHCYINLPTHAPQAEAEELTLEEIESIAEQAAELGALWCLLTGGEPLLRKDFPDIYRRLKQKGLLVSVFTNACLVSDEHVRLFQEYPPRDVEVTVYGATKETYERVTRKPGSYAAFRRGLERLLQGGVKVRLKAMALRSNLAEMEAIGRLCGELTKDYYRFDPLLHLRLDGDERRNAEIRSERLSAAEIARLDQSEPGRWKALQEDCAHTSLPSSQPEGALAPVLQCGAGLDSFCVGYDGILRLCEVLVQPGFTTSLRQGSLRTAWESFIPQVRSLRWETAETEKECPACSLRNLCLWCPAHGALETGELAGHSVYFCDVAHARQAALAAGGQTSP